MNAGNAGQEDFREPTEKDVTSSAKEAKALSTGKKSFECKICSMTFKFQQNLKYHTSLHEKEGKNNTCRTPSKSPDENTIEEPGKSSEVFRVGDPATKENHLSKETTLVLPKLLGRMFLYI